MQWVKIQIVDKADNARAIVELGSRGRIDCYPDRTYMVPEPALKLLKDLKVTYQELGRGGMDYAEKTLRDSVAANAKRRKPSKPRKARADN